MPRVGDGAHDPREPPRSLALWILNRRRTGKCWRPHSERKVGYCAEEEGSAPASSQPLAPRYTAAHFPATRSPVTSFMLQNYELTRRILGHLNPVEFIAFSPNGMWFLTASSVAGIKTWDSRTLALKGCVRLGHEGGQEIAGIAINDTATTAAWCTGLSVNVVQFSAEGVPVWDTGKVLQRWTQTPSLSLKRVFIPAVCFGGEHFLAASTGSRLLVFEVECISPPVPEALFGHSAVAPAVEWMQYRPYVISGVRPILLSWSSYYSGISLLAVLEEGHLGLYEFTNPKRNVTTSRSRQTIDGSKRLVARLKFRLAIASMEFAVNSPVLFLQTRMGVPMLLYYAPPTSKSKYYFYSLTCGLSMTEECDDGLRRAPGTLPFHSDLGVSFRHSKHYCVTPGEVWDLNIMHLLRKDPKDLDVSYDLARDGVLTLVGFWRGLCISTRWNAYGELMHPVPKLLYQNGEVPLGIRMHPLAKDVVSVRLPGQEVQHYDLGVSGSVARCVASNTWRGIDDGSSGLHGLCLEYNNDGSILVAADNFGSFCILTNRCLVAPGQQRVMEEAPSQQFFESEFDLIQSERDTVLTLLPLRDTDTLASPGGAVGRQESVHHVAVSGCRLCTERQRVVPRVRQHEPDNEETLVMALSTALEEETLSDPGAQSPARSDAPPDAAPAAAPQPPAPAQQPASPEASADTSTDTDPGNLSTEDDEHDSSEYEPASPGGSSTRSDDTIPSSRPLSPSHTEGEADSEAEEQPYYYMDYPQLKKHCARLLIDTDGARDRKQLLKRATAYWMGVEAQMQESARLYHQTPVRDLLQLCELRGVEVVSSASKDRILMALTADDKRRAVETETVRKGIDQLTVLQLRELCERHGLTRTGNKLALQARLRQWLDDQAALQSPGAQLYLARPPGELRDICRERDLVADGSKEQLARRLQQHDKYRKATLVTIRSLCVTSGLVTPRTRGAGIAMLMRYCDAALLPTDLPAEHRPPVTNEVQSEAHDEPMEGLPAEEDEGEEEEEEEQDYEGGAEAEAEEESDGGGRVCGEEAYRSQLAGMTYLELRRLVKGRARTRAALIEHLVQERFGASDEGDSGEDEEEEEEEDESAESDACPAPPAARGAVDAIVRQLAPYTLIELRGMLDTLLLNNINYANKPDLLRKLAVHIHRVGGISHNGEWLSHKPESDAEEEDEEEEEATESSSLNVPTIDEGGESDDSEERRVTHRQMESLLRVLSIPQLRMMCKGKATPVRYLRVFRDVLIAKINAWKARQQKKTAFSEKMRAITNTWQAERPRQRPSWEYQSQSSSEEGDDDVTHADLVLPQEVRDLTPSDDTDAEDDGCSDASSARSPPHAADGVPGTQASQATVVVGGGGGSSSPLKRKRVPRQKAMSCAELLVICRRTLPEGLVGFLSKVADAFAEGRKLARERRAAERQASRQPAARSRLPPAKRRRAAAAAAAPQSGGEESLSKVYKTMLKPELMSLCKAMSIPFIRSKCNKAQLVQLLTEGTVNGVTQTQSQAALGSLSQGGRGSASLLRPSDITGSLPIPTPPPRPVPINYETAPTSELRKLCHDSAIIFDNTMGRGELIRRLHQHEARERLSRLSEVELRTRCVLNNLVDRGDKSELVGRLVSCGVHPNSPTAWEYTDSSMTVASLEDSQDAPFVCQAEESLRGICRAKRICCERLTHGQIARKLSVFEKVDRLAERRMSEIPPAQLRSACERLGVSSSGTPRDLLRRLSHVRTNPPIRSIEHGQASQPLGEEEASQA